MVQHRILLAVALLLAPVGAWAGTHQGEGGGAAHGDGTNCAAGNYPLGVDANGNAQGCAAAGTPGEDSIGTFELDDGADTPLAGEWVQVDPLDITQFNYRTDAELKSDIAIVAADIGDQNAGTDITADLEEESHATEHQHGGADEVATATPGANAIPKAGAGGTIADGWLSSTNALDSELHAESHTIASHSDTTATGAELETLTDGSNADALHEHATVAVTGDSLRWDATADCWYRDEDDDGVLDGSATPAEQCLTGYERGVILVRDFNLDSNLNDVDIQRAITLCGSGVQTTDFGCTILMPEGTFTLTSELLFDQMTGIRFLGAGSGRTRSDGDPTAATRLNWTGTGAGLSVIKLMGVQGFEMAHFAIDGDQSATSAADWCLEISGDSDDARTTQDVWIHDISAAWCANGVLIAEDTDLGGDTDDQVDGVRITDSRITDVTGVMVRIDSANADGTVIERTRFDAFTGTTAFDLVDGDLNFRDNIVDIDPTGEVFLVGSTWDSYRIEGNIFEIGNGKLIDEAAATRGNGGLLTANIFQNNEVTAGTTGPINFVDIQTGRLTVFSGNTFGLQGGTNLTLSITCGTGAGETCNSTPMQAFIGPNQISANYSWAAITANVQTEINGLVLMDKIAVDIDTCTAALRGSYWWDSVDLRFEFCEATSGAPTNLGAGSGSLPVTDTTSIVEGSVDPTKEVRFEVDGLTTATTRVLTVPDADLTIVGTATAQTLTNKTINGATIDGTSTVDGITATNLVDKSAAESISGAWDWTDTGTFDFGGPVTATSFSADDQEASASTTNLLGVLDDDNATGDSTCALAGTAGQLSILDTDETATDDWKVCDGTADLLDFNAVFPSATTVDDDAVAFDDANSDWTATDVGSALEELVTDPGAGPNLANGKVHWDQLVGVPAGFADNTDDGAGGSGDAIEVEDGDDAGTFTPIDTTARFEDQGDINFAFTDGGAGGPDTITATVRANSVALGTDTTGNYAAGDAEAGAALTGDSATAFFSAGQIEAARGGTGIDSSASTGVARVSAGTWTADAGVSHLAASTSADLRGVLSDESGTGAAIFAGGAIGAATATTPAVDDNDTSVATTAFVQSETVAAGDVTGSIGGGLTIGADTVDASMISTLVKSMYWGAGAVSADGANCADPAEVNIGSWGKMYTVICGDNDASTIEGSTVMPDGWDAGTVTFELAVIQDAADTSALQGDFAARCAGDTETPAAYGTEVAADDTMTGTDAINKVTTGAVTPAGTCAAGDLLQWRYQVDATGTTTGMTTLNIVGVKMEYTWNPAD